MSIFKETKTNIFAINSNILYRMVPIDLVTSFLHFLHLIWKILVIWRNLKFFFEILVPYSWLDYDKPLLPNLIYFFLIIISFFLIDLMNFFVRSPLWRPGDFLISYCIFILYNRYSIVYSSQFHSLIQVFMAFLNFESNINRIKFF